MDLSGENFCTHDYPETFSPPRLSNHFKGFPVYWESDIKNSFKIPYQSTPPANLERLAPHRFESIQMIDHLLKKVFKDDLPGSEHLVSYIRHQYRRNCRPSTLRNIHGTVGYFLKFLCKEGSGCFEEMTKWDVEGFIEHEQDRGLKLSTVRTRLAILKAFIHFLIEKKVLSEDVFPWKMKIKPPEILPRAMDPDDVNRLIKAKANSRDRAMVLLLLRTGMRIGELLNIVVNDINLKERKVMIHEGLKNRRGRVVYYGDDAGDALKIWLKKKKPNTEIVFYGQKDKPLSYPAARMAFVKYLKRAGLPDKGYTLHCLRHTYATELLNAGMRLECLETLMGHTSLEVTRRYARLTDRTREEQYFKAMKIIEGSETDDDDKCDR
jgi:integrase/recombinase XerD